MSFENERYVSNKSVIINYQMDRIVLLEQENVKLQEENARLRTILTELIDESIDNLLDLKKNVHNTLIKEIKNEHKNI